MSEHIIPTNRNFKNRIGMTFGRLTVVAFAGHKMSGGEIKYQWLCRCACGMEIIRPGDRLKPGGTEGCGCLRSERVAASNTKHGLSYSRLWRTWSQMKTRCENPKAVSYPRYGGRGITVCSEWHDFPRFAADMGEPPSGMTIERIDGEKGYSKENCKWATPKEQSRNRPGFVRPITVNNVTKLLEDWAKELGSSSALVSRRIERGWDIARAVTEPPRPHKPYAPRRVRASAPCEAVA